QIEDFADLRDAFAVHDVELDLLERRSDLILHHFDACGIADNVVAILDLTRAADIEPDRSIEFQCITACGGLRIAVHHADLHAQLIDEDDHAARAADRAGQLAQALAHQPGLKAHVAVAHLALD